VALGLSIASLAVVSNPYPTKSMRRRVSAAVRPAGSRVATAAIGELTASYQYWAGTGRRAVSPPSALATTRRVGLTAGGVAVTFAVTHRYGRALGIHRPIIIRRYLSGVQRRPDRSVGSGDCHPPVRIRSPGREVVRPGGSHIGSQRPAVAAAQCWQQWPHSCLALRVRTRLLTRKLWAQSTT
jgi:hypothetical protein